MPALQLTSDSWWRAPKRVMGLLFVVSLTDAFLSSRQPAGSQQSGLTASLTLANVLPRGEPGAGTLSPSIF